MMARFTPCWRPFIKTTNIIMIHERMAEQFKHRKEMSKAYEESKAKQLRRGRFIVYSFFLSAVGGLVTALTARAIKESQHAPDWRFYEYKRRLLHGKAEEDNNHNNDNDASTLHHATFNERMNRREMIAADQYIDWKRFGMSAFAGMSLSYLFFRAVFKRRIITCSPDKYLIIFKKHRGHDYDNGIFNEMLESGQAKFVKPILEGYGFLNAGDIPVQLHNFQVETRDKFKVNINLRMNVGVGKLATEVSFASSKHLDKSIEEMARMATEILQSAFKDNIKELKFSEIEQNSEDFFIYLQQITAWFMKYIGFYVRDCPFLAYEAGNINLSRKHLKKKDEE